MGKIEYKKRLVDNELDLKLKTFGGVLIVGPKGCGKTTTAKQKAKSIVEFQDEDLRDNYLLIANTHPSDLLKGDKPRLFDEWQDAPKIWGSIRKSIDDEDKVGLYILTGSSSNIADTPHTGTLRISRLKMYPMSLYESGESTGEVSLRELFDNKDSFSTCESKLSIDDIKYVICRGGWPLCFKSQNLESQLLIARDLFYQTCDVDISNIDNVKKNPIWARAILKSYARNICTLADQNTIFADVQSTYEISRQTYINYIEALQKLFIIEDIDAWCPSIRSRTTIRSSKKKNVIDPSIAAAALGVTPYYFDQDYKTLGFLFESLCIRDLKIYSNSMDGNISYYRDRYGLEADGVLHLCDGRYALIEFKLGQSEIDEGAKHLLKIEELIMQKNKEEKQCKLRLPDLKIVITATKYGYKREDGVFVIPIGCLKD